MFQKFYSDMLNIMPTTVLTGHLVSANIITPTEDEEVTSPSTSTERARKLLLKMSGALKSGYTISFYALLDALEKFGNKNCNMLASKMRKELLVEGNQGTYYVYVCRCTCVRMYYHTWEILNGEICQTMPVHVKQLDLVATQDNHQL